MHEHSAPVKMTASVPTTDSGRHLSRSVAGLTIARGDVIHGTSRWKRLPRSCKTESVSRSASSSRTMMPQPSTKYSYSLSAKEGKVMASPQEQEGIVWRKSSASAGTNCVEVASAGMSIYVRDSKNPGGPILSFDHAEWIAFLVGAQQGVFDILDPRI